MRGTIDDGFYGAPELVYETEGPRAFAGLKGPCFVTVPASVKSLDPTAFDDCEDCKVSFRAPSAV